MMQQVTVACEVPGCDTTVTVTMPPVPPDGPTDTWLAQVVNQAGFLAKNAADHDASHFMAQPAAGGGDVAIPESLYDQDGNPVVTLAPNSAVVILLNHDGTYQIVARDGITAQNLSAALTHCANALVTGP